MNGGKVVYYVKAFFIVFMMQALFSMIVNSSGLFVCIWSNDDVLIWLDYVGLAVWIAGFVFELVGD